jgi:hypothetical protein
VIVGVVPRTNALVPVVPLVPDKYPNCVLVTVECVGIPFESDISALFAVIAADSTIAEPEDCITRLLLKAVLEFVPPLTTAKVPLLILPALREVIPDPLPDTAPLIFVALTVVAFTVVNVEVVAFKPLTVKLELLSLSIVGT